MGLTDANGAKMRNCKKKHSKVANAKLGACVLWLRERERCGDAQSDNLLIEFRRRACTPLWVELRQFPGSRASEKSHTRLIRKEPRANANTGRGEAEKRRRAPCTTPAAEASGERESNGTFSLTLLEIIAAHAPNSSAGEEAAEIFDCFLPIRPRIRGPNLPSSSGPRSHACGATGLRFNWPLKN
jgi:hypothetical protein